jgi:hypothetical protein
MVPIGGEWDAPGRSKGEAVTMISPLGGMVTSDRMSDAIVPDHPAGHT